MFDPVPLPEGLDAQKSGAAITYFRRYSLASVFLLEALDDDGESLRAKPEPKPTYTKPKAKPLSNLPPEPFDGERPIIKSETIAQIKELVEQKGLDMDAVKERAHAKYGVYFEMLAEEEGQEILKALKK